MTINAIFMILEEKKKNHIAGLDLRSVSGLCVQETDVPFLKRPYDGQGSWCLRPSALKRHHMAKMSLSVWCLRKALAEHHCLPMQAKRCRHITLDTKQGLKS